MTGPTERICRAELVRDDDSIFRQNGKSLIGFVCKITQNPARNIPHVIDPGSEIGVFHCRKRFANFMYDRLNGGFSVDLACANLRFGTGSHPSRAEHRSMCIKQWDKFLRNRFRHIRRFLAKFANLLLSLCQSRLETLYFRLDKCIVQFVFR